VTATELMKKIQEGLDRVPDSDGEPGYAFATEAHDLKNEGFAILDITALVDDTQPLEEEFELLIRKKTPRTT